jgi:hypothetical protein
MILESSAFLAFSDDIKNRSFADWLEAHTSFMRPFHKYRGSLSINGDILLFTGTEKKTGKDFQLNLLRGDIQELYLGFDSVFTIFETRNFGFGWKPLRITYIRNNSTIQLYLIINYSLGRTDNAIWMEILKNWLRC